MERTLAATIDLATAAGIEPHIRFTAAFSDGEALYAVRFATDAFAPTLFSSPVGGNGSHCLVSEPFNDEAARWAEIPANSFVRIDAGGMTVSTFAPRQDKATPRLRRQARVSELVKPDTLG